MNACSLSTWKLGQRFREILSLQHLKHLKWSHCVIARMETYWNALAKKIQLQESGIACLLEVVWGCWPRPAARHGPIWSMSLSTKEHAMTCSVCPIHRFLQVPVKLYGRQPHRNLCILSWWKESWKMEMMKATFPCPWTFSTASRLTSQASFFATAIVGSTAGFAIQQK